MSKGYHCVDTVRLHQFLLWFQQVFWIGNVGCQHLSLNGYLELSNGGLSDCTTNCIDFNGLSILEVLDLRGNKFSSMPSGIGFLPKLRVLFVHGCKYLVSIPDLPLSIRCLCAAHCKSLERVRIPIE